MKIIEQAKLESRGQERHVISSLCQVEDEWFDGRGRACPKCGGDDRFSWVKKNQAFLCRTCFLEGSHPDVIGSVAWLLGVEQSVAAKQVLDLLGVDWKEQKPKKGTLKRSFRELKPGKFNGSLATQWVSSNPPISVSAIRESGCTFGTWFANSVASFPVVGPKLKKQPLSADNHEIIGYSLYATIQGGPGSYIDVKRGNRLSQQRSITVNKYNASSPQIGIIGPWERFLAAAKVVKCEGTTDMLAANSMLPNDWVAITNSCGSKATSEWMAELMQGKDVWIIHDNDESGRAGAELWRKKIESHAANMYVPRLLEEGMDLRDFLKDSNQIEFVRFLESFVKADDADKEPAAGSDSVEEAEEESVQVMARCLEDLILDVLFEDSDSRIEVYCGATKKNASIKSLSRWDYSDAIQLTGGRAINFIAADPESHQYSIHQVREAIALQASSRRVSSTIDMSGIGIWPGKDVNELVVCNGSHLSIWSGEELRIHVSPRYANRIFGFGHADWYDHDELADCCQRCLDVEYRHEVIRRVERIVARWTWGNDFASQIITGLIGCTLLQTVWKWRPMVSILGESNTGKSSLMDFLSQEEELSLFGALSFRTSDTTRAGISQDVNADSKAIFIDEWDSHPLRIREAILKAFRGSTGGGTSKRGTAHHQGHQFRFQHLAWLAGRYSSISDDADQNRFIEFELKKPTEIRWNAFVMPSGEESKELGLKMIALSIVSARRALEVQPILERTEIAKEIHPRVIRNLSVPASFLASAWDLSEEDAKILTASFTGSFVGSESIEIQPKHVEYLQRLMSSLVDIGGGRKIAVSNLISSQGNRDSYRDEMHSHGVDVKRILFEDGTDGQFLVITNLSHIITEDTDRSIRSVLLRVPNALRWKVKMNRSAMNGTAIPLQFIQTTFDTQIDYDS